jgi:hypothetical protein
MLVLVNGAVAPARTDRTSTGVKSTVSDCACAATENKEKQKKKFRFIYKNLNERECSREVCKKKATFPAQALP